MVVNALCNSWKLIWLQYQWRWRCPIWLLRGSPSLNHLLNTRIKIWGKFKNVSWNEIRSFLFSSMMTNERKKSVFIQIQRSQMVQTFWQNVFNLSLFLSLFHSSRTLAHIHMHIHNISHIHIHTPTHTLSTHSHTKTMHTRTHAHPHTRACSHCFMLTFTSIHIRHKVKPLDLSQNYLTQTSVPLVTQIIALWEFLLWYLLLTIILEIVLLIIVYLRVYKWLHVAKNEC